MKRTCNEMTPFEHLNEGKRGFGECENVYIFRAKY